MGKHAIVLILVYLFYLGLALPIKENTNQAQNVFTNEFLSLANSCENLSLADLIRSKIDYCNIAVPMYSQRDLECIMFYDINSQLCKALGRAPLDLRANYTSRIQKTQNVMSLCDDAKTWKSITPKYKIVLEKLFSTKVACLKVCNVNEVMSDDSNFFCKYFKWGSDMLSHYGNPEPKTSTIIESPLTGVKPEVSPDIPVTTNNAATLQNSNLDSQPAKNQLGTSPKLETTLKTDVDKQELNKETPAKVTVSTLKPDVKETISNVDINVEENTSTSKIVPIKHVEETPPLQDMNKETKNNEFKPVIENPKEKLNPELDENFDNEFGNDLDPEDDPLSDQDPVVGNEVLNADPKIDNEPAKENSNINKLPLTSFNIDVPQRESIYPNSIQDTFAEDDDHFFPFFLTTIIFVVLLYILYHNKSKVTKLVLGLIVEGRQSNRRRNSRGHAYRRLDTLEQAMTANSTAPPSKIIY